ncbi:MAG: hypothetical protein ACLFQ6_08515 [Candidatus Sumerlaeia bacterium]
MNKITQSVAANAEESASASEELNAQAGSMHNVVEDLTRLVGGLHDPNGSANGHRKPHIAAEAQHSIATHKNKRIE